MNRFFIFLLFLIMAACAPSPEENANTDETPATPEMGYSGLVTVRHLDLDIKSPQLPPQITVEFERQSTYSRDLLLLKSFFRRLSLSMNEDVVSIGCGEKTDIVAFPASLSVDILKICGKHQIGHNNVNVNANILILDSSELEFIPSEAQRENSDIRMTSKEFVIVGQNKMTLQGAQIPGGRTLPPTLILDAGSVMGNGHLTIISKANIFPVKR